MEKFNRVIAFARARDSEKTQKSVLDFVYNKLTGTLGPCGSTTPDIYNTTRFYFDTFCGLSIPITPLVFGPMDDDKDLLLENLSGKEIKMTNYLFSLNDCFFKIYDKANGEYFREDYLIFLRNFISYCGGGVIKWLYKDEDNNQEYMKFEIISGYKHTEEEIKNAITITNKLVNANKNNSIFSNEELEIATKIGFDEIPHGYFVGLSNGFLEGRCVITKESDNKTYKKLQCISSMINKKFMNLYPRVCVRVNKMGDRLNLICFIQYLIQIKEMNIYVDNIDDIEELNYLMDEHLEEYKEWLQRLGYNVDKNTKGIEVLFHY